MKYTFIFLFILLVAPFAGAQNLTLHQLLKIKKMELGNGIENDVDNYMLSVGWKLIERKKPTGSNLRGISKYQSSNNDLPEYPSLRYSYYLNSENTRVELSNIESKAKLDEYIDALIKIDAQLISKKESDGILTLVVSKDNFIFVIKNGGVEWAFGYEEVRSILIMTTKDYNTNFQ